MTIIETKLSESSESCRNLKNLLEASQSELTKYKIAEGETKVEIVPVSSTLKVKLNGREQAIAACVR